jgi:WD40 repeat protein
MEGNQKYFAFISYKREDAKWAKWLKKKLEHYHLPSSLNGHDIPENMRYVYRDVENLTSGGLTQRIHDALDKSQNLIVLCSPRVAADPKWINDEINYFKEKKGIEKIFPFIIEGIPHAKEKEKECFPSALEKLTKNEERIGGNVNEGGEDFAAVKLIAGLLGITDINYLWDDYAREQKLRRWMWLIGAIIVALTGLGIGIYFIKQNKVVESQNIQLQNLVKELKEENNTYSQLQSDQKHYVFVGQIRGSGCFNLSLMDFAYHPYEPIIAFTDNKGLWIHYLNSNVEINMPSFYKGKQIIDIGDLRFSADGAKLIASGYTSDLIRYEYVWDVESGELIGPSILDEYDSVWKNKDTRLSKEIKYEFKNGELYLYNIEGRNICSTSFDSEPRCIYNPVYDEIIFISKNRAALYEDTKKDFVLFFKGYNDSEEIEFSEYGDYLRIENNIYERAIKIDTIQDIRYSVHRMENYPQLQEEINCKYDSINHASLDVSEGFLVYKRGNYVKRKDVVQEYTIGNIQEYLVDALFAGPHKVIAIVEQGKFRIYNSKTWKLLGTLTNYIYTIEGGIDDDGGYGHEGDLGHWSSYIALTKYIKNKLYVLSSGGIMRIYDVNKYRLETVIELPIENRGDPIGTLFIEKCYLSDDASRVIYSLGQSFYYDCELPQKK